MKILFLTMITLILAPLELLHGNEVDDLENQLKSEASIENDIQIIKDSNNANINNLDSSNGYHSGHNKSYNSQKQNIKDSNNANINNLESNYYDNPLDINVDPEKTAKMRVEPKARSLDYAEAFESLRRSNPRGNVYAIVDGISYDHIVGVENTSNGTLVKVKTEYNGYEEEHIFKVEDIDKMSIRSSRKGSNNITIPKGWQ